MITNKKVMISLLFIMVFLVPNFYAQSGRKRPNQPSQPSPTKTTEPKTTNPTNSKNPPPATNKPAVPGRVLVPAGAAIVAQEHIGVTSRYVFKNGVTVIVREDHSVPLAAATILVKGGTSLETEDQAGVARVVERLLTDSATNEDDPLKQLRNLGGVLNSNTNFQGTNYSLLGQSANFTKLLEMLFRNLQKQSFTDEDFSRAAKFVLQTNSYKLDDPFNYSQQRIAKAAFDNNASTGLLDETKLITKEQAQNFYNNYYTGNNLIVVIVGDITADNARLAAQQFLGAVKAGTNLNKTTVKTSEGAPIRYIAERADINQTVVSVGYRVSGVKETAVFEVLQAILTKGRGALLSQSLLDASFASKVAAEYLTTNKGALFTFQMQVVPSKLVKAENALFEQIENLRRIILSAAELQRAKALLEKDYYDSTLDLTRLSTQIALGEVRGSYKDFDSYVKRIRAVTGEQVQELAAQYFNFSTSVVHEYEPNNAPSRIAGADPFYTPDRFDSYIKVLVPNTHKESVSKDEISYATEKPLAKQGKDKFEQTTEGGFILELQPEPARDFTTLRGPRSIVREDPARPLIAIGFYFQGGRLIEKDDVGITELMLRTILRGTQRQTGAELALILEQLGAEVTIINEPDFFGYNIEVISRNAEPAMRLLISTIENALFDKEDFAREKASLLAAIQASKDDSLQLATNLTNTLLYSGHPYAFSQIGLETSISRLKEDDVVEWYKKTVKRQLPLVVIVGDTEGSSLVGRLVADGFSRSDESLDKALAVPVVAVQNAPGEKAELKDRRQTTQVLQFSGPEGKSDDNYVLEVLRQIIDGPTGRILTALQQQQLSFEINTETKMRQQRSGFLVTLNSPADQEQKARTLVESEFKKLVSNPVTDQEVMAARNSAAAVLAQKLRDHSQRAITYARYAFYGMPFADVDNVGEKISAITKDDVKKVIQNYFLVEKRALGVIRSNAQPKAQP